MNTSNYIPRDVLLQAKIRSIDQPEMKAAVICKQNPNLKITPVASELGANYQRAWRRYTALKERGEFTGPGRPIYFSKKYIYRRL